MQTPAQQPVTSTPTTSKPAASKTPVLIVVIVLFIFIATAVGYYFGTLQKKEPPPVPSPTSTVIAPSSTPAQTSWKTYTDSKIGFSFQYPSDWQVITLPDPSAGIALKSPAYEPIVSGNVTFDGEIYIKAGNNPKNTPIQKVFEGYNDTSKFWFSQFPYENITTPLPGVKFPSIKEAGSDITRTDYIFSPSGKLIFFTYLYKTPEVMNIYSQIINSLKVNEPAGVTYTNTKYGFTLTLPELWRGYEVTRHTSDNTEIICFTIKNSPESMPYCLLNIYVYTKDAWNALANKPYLITQNNQFVFTSDHQDGGCVQLDAFQCARVQENPGIIASFKFTSP